MTARPPLFELTLDDPPPSANGLFRNVPCKGRVRQAIIPAGAAAASVVFVFPHRHPDCARQPALSAARKPCPQDMDCQKKSAENDNR